MATFVQRHPLLFGLQWASLDIISGGRSILAACMGYPADQIEHAARELDAMGVRTEDRPARLIEHIKILRRLWTGEETSYRGRFYNLDRVTLDVKPVQQPYPIWIASNPQVRRIGEQGLERALRRVARHADGWMTTVLPPEEFVKRWARVQAMAREEGRALDPRATILIYNLTVNPNRDAAYDETCRFLADYYRRELPSEMVRVWCEWGTADQCAETMQRYVDTGCGAIVVRMCSWDQRGQIKKFVDEVLPRVKRRALAA